MSIYNTLLKLKKANKPFGIQKAINIMHHSPHSVFIDLDNIESVVLNDGSIFRASDQCNMLQKVVGNPWFEGIRDTDVAMDIGANIGAVAIPLAKVAKRVIAVEPLYHQELNDNLKINKINNTSIWPVALSELEDVKVSFSTKSPQWVRGYTLSQMLYVAEEPVDFLKVDCEGGEWCIDPEEVAGIRELRFEFHIRRNHFNQDVACLFGDWYDWLVSNSYSFEISEGDAPPPFHEIRECYLLRATKQ